MKQQTRRGAISHEDPWRWLTFSSFWGSIYYLLVYAGIIVGHRSKTAQFNRRPLLVSLLLFLLFFISGSTLLSVIEQLVVRRSAKEQSRRAIASGLLEPSIPLQAIGGAAGAVGAFGLAAASNQIAERITHEPVFPAPDIDWPRALAATSIFSGLASLAVSRIAAWVAEDAQAVAK